MNILNNSSKVSWWLVGREIGFCRKELKFDRAQIIQNIANDCFSSTMITINENSSLCQEIIRAEDFVAVRQGVIISLWNIFLGVKVREYIELPDFREVSMSLLYSKLLVDRDGLLAKIYRSDYPCEQTYVEFFFEGKKTGSIYFKNYLKKFQLINSHFFAKGIDSEPARDSSGCLLNEKLHLYEWDKTGKLIRKISLAPFCENNDFIFENNLVANKNYLVSYFGTFFKPNVSSKILVCNLKTESHEVFNLEVDSYNQDITAVYLLENRIVMANNKSECIPDFGEIKSDLKISVFNLITGMFEKKYILEEKESIRYLVANEEYAFFSIDSIKIFSLNLMTGNRDEILTLSNHANHNLQLSIMDDILSVCFSKGTWNGSDVSDRQVRIDYDIKANKIINKIKYYRFPIKYSNISSLKLSFESGVFAFQVSEDEIQRIYLESYSGFYLHESKINFRV